MHFIVWVLQNKNSKPIPTRFSYKRENNSMKKYILLNFQKIGKIWELKTDTNSNFKDLIYKKIKLHLNHQKVYFLFFKRPKHVRPTRDHIPKKPELHPLAALTCHPSGNPTQFFPMDNWKCYFLRLWAAHV